MKPFKFFKKVSHTLQVYSMKILLGDSNKRSNRLPKGKFLSNLAVSVGRSNIGIVREEFSLSLYDTMKFCHDLPKSM